MAVALAIDVYVPRAKASSERQAYPTIVVFTPYYRRFRMRPGGAGEVSPGAGKLRDLFVPRGYALVVVDVRGTGASFGTRDSFRSPKEREDSREVVDWIVAQPWSDGLVGSTGVSYLGAAADFLASTGHTAVKAIAPLFSVWDTYADNYFPGGLLRRPLRGSTTNSWSPSTMIGAISCSPFPISTILASTVRDQSMTIPTAPAFARPCISISATSGRQTSCRSSDFGRRD